MENFVISKINLRVPPKHKNTNNTSIDTSESENDSGKVSKQATSYSGKDTPISKSLAMLTETLFVLYYHMC
jgi:hypothetical protein